jgi:hypothetical protein
MESMQAAYNTEYRTTMLKPIYQGVLRSLVVPESVTVPDSASTTAAGIPWPVELHCPEGVPS